MNTTQIKEDLNEIDCVQDVTVWRRPFRRGGHITGGPVSSISVDMLPASSTRVLNDVMKEHELVIKEAEAGAEGMAVKLQEEGRVHDTDLADRLETFADLADVSDDEYTRLIDAVDVIRDFRGGFR